MSSDLLCLTRAERAALFSGIPAPAVLLYLWLRERMTWKTRLVGFDPRAAINWQAICEALATEWRRGWIDAPSPSAARRTAAHLVRAGLVVMRSNSTERRLIFECVLAPQNSSVQKMADRSKRGHPDRPPQREKPGHPDRSKNGHPDRHLDFVSTVVHQVARAEKNAVDKCNLGELYFPPLCSSQVNRALGALIRKSNANGSAQLLLDQVAARQEQQNPLLEDPIRYLAALIEANDRGEFWPTNAAMNIKRRRAEAETHCTIAAPHKATASGRAIAREAIATLKKMTLQ